ncbi:MAG: class I SAM-dependent methyltransferase [Rhodobacteraceae bacterium]|nr:class I SAM-dependent methyltransferase [Paracoccaceae bacterium]
MHKCITDQRIHSIHIQNTFVYVQSQRRTHMQQAVTFWDNIAESYAKSPISDMDAYTYTLGRTRSYLSPTDSILELGCGTGSTALLLAENVAQVTASDLSGNMTRIGAGKAKEQGISNVRFVTGDVLDETAESESGPFDAVLALNLLHLLEDVPATICRIHRLLKPGGLFISKTTCNPGSGSHLKFRLIKMALPVMQLFGKAPYVNFMEIEELEGIISGSGFDILETGNYPASPPNRYVVARKI